MFLQHIAMHTFIYKCAIPTSLICLFCKTVLFKRKFIHTIEMYAHKILNLIIFILLNDKIIINAQPPWTADLLFDPLPPYKRCGTEELINVLDNNLYLT
jgi:hypothetical protein